MAEGREQTQGEDAVPEPNCTCSNPECDYRMWVGPLKAPAGIAATFIAFCPLCHYEMRRDDALGQLEAEFDGEPKTFEQFAAQNNVLGIIHAEVPDDA